MVERPSPNAPPEARAAPNAPPQARAAPNAPPQARAAISIAERDNVVRRGAARRVGAE